MSITRRTAEGPARMSFPQERLFLLDQIMPGMSAYNVPTLYRVAATLDENVLQKAFDAVVERHEILRTSLRLLDGEPVQQVRPHQPFELLVEDLRGHAEADREDEAQSILGEAVRRPFDLAGDVLLRAALVHLAPGDDLLLVVFHHTGSDHLSTGILFDELDELYDAILRGREPRLPALPIQYADFAEWQRAHLEGETLEELTAYWTEQLAGAPERLELPADRPRPGVQSYRGAWDQTSLPAATVTPLRELARREGVSLFMVLLAGFTTLLHRYTGAEDVVLGTPVSGRHYEEIEHLLGCFTNTLALRSDLSGDPTFAELLGRVKQTTLGGLTYQELPFEKLVEVLNPERARSHSPIFQVLFAYDIVAGRERTLAGAPARQEPAPGWEAARLDLSVNVQDLPDGSLRLNLGYSTDLFDASRIARLGAHLEVLLSAAAADPQLRLSELPMLTDAERRLLLETWNETAAAYDARCLHELISSQALRTPDAIAVVSAEGQATYGALEQRSNQLARHLASLGAEPGTLVGISLERGIDMVVALLGVLKSGAGYVPIDPTYPPDRQELMLRDSGARVLLTQDRFAGIVDPGSAGVLRIDREWPVIAEHSSDALGRTADPDALAYVIYTSGSTGRPKGVEISHRALVNFLAAMRRTPGSGPRTSSSP